MNSYYVVYSVNNVLYSDVFNTNEVTIDTLLELTDPLMQEYKTPSILIVNWKRID